MRWMILLTLLVWLPVRAQSVLFYQPLNIDASVQPAQWQTMLDDSREAGFDTLVVQWMQHDESDFGGSDGWLVNLLRRAQADGFALVLGLYHDSAYYPRMMDGHAAPMEWYQWLARSLDLQRWLRANTGLQPKGWYLPMELDDRLFSDPASRDVLARQLKVFRGLLDAPLHVSAFSAGVLTPETYAAWLDSLPADQVWWQDGRGTGDLSADILEVYRGALSCRIGIVAEAFRQVSNSCQRFVAIPAVPRFDTGCHRRAVFSLRYLPWGAPLLENMRAR
jgi:hypothetical protein